MANIVSICENNIIGHKYQPFRHGWYFQSAPNGIDVEGWVSRHCLFCPVFWAAMEGKQWRDTKIIIQILVYIADTCFPINFALFKFSIISHCIFNDRNRLFYQWSFLFIDEWELNKYYNIGVTWLLLGLEFCVTKEVLWSTSLSSSLSLWPRKTIIFNKIRLIKWNNAVFLILNSCYLLTCLFISSFLAIVNLKCMQFSSRIASEKWLVVDLSPFPLFRHSSQSVMLCTLSHQHVAFDLSWLDWLGLDH